MAEPEAYCSEPGCLMRAGHPGHCEKPCVRCGVTTNMFRYRNEFLCRACMEDAYPDGMPRDRLLYSALRDVVNMAGGRSPVIVPKGRDASKMRLEACLKIARDALQEVEA